MTYFATAWFGVLCLLFVPQISKGMPQPPGNRNTRAAPPRIDLADAARYLWKYGYVSETKTSQTLAAVQDLNPSTLQAPIRQFQRLAGLPETGDLDGETMRFMVMPRCGVEDTVGSFSMGSKGFNTRGRGHFEKKRKKGKRKGRKRSKSKGGKAKSRTKRYDLQGLKWKKRSLTYAVMNFTPDMTKDQIRTAIRKALKLWEDSSSLKFTETTDKENADIKISFGRGDHGDRFAFDGSGGTLAHAFFPESGEAHFDEDEVFSDKGQGTNLHIVAAHEFGHSLGLGHSTVQQSLMAPFYQGYVEDFELHPDDVAAIQELYGERVNDKVERPVTPRATAKPRKPKPTKKPRQNVPNICKTNVDAMISYMNGSDVTYAFKGSYYYKINDFEILPGFPKKIGKHWKGLPGNLNGAAHSRRTGKTYFFKGNQVYCYRGTRLLPGYPRSAKSMHLPGHPRAALTWGSDGMIYVFKQKTFYKFDDYKMRVWKPMSVTKAWKGVPEEIDAAFTWSRNRKTYFVQDNRYWRFNDNQWKVDAGYPRNFNKEWLGCRTPSNIRASTNGSRKKNRNRARKKSGRRT